MESCTISGKRPTEYQRRAVDQLRAEFAKGHRKSILTLPCGSGKTFIAAMISRRVVDYGETVLFLAHRREILYQAQEAMMDFGIPAGLILAGEPKTPQAPVQICSKDTLAARDFRPGRMLPRSDVLFVDEAHRSMGAEYLAMIDQMAHGKFVVGLTATPGRADGKALGSWWNGMVQPVRMEELVAAGRLVRCRAFAPTIPDMRRVQRVLWEQEGAKRMDTPKLIGDVFDHWKRLAEDRSTVIFASSIKHSVHLMREFQRRGVTCEHIDGTTPKDERADILKSVDSGDTQVLVNVDVMSEGVDIPKVSALVLAAPTKSIVRYLQRAGRALRTFPGKKDALIIDHSGVTLQFPLPDEDFVWHLDTSQNINIKAERGKMQDKREQRLCSKCFTLFYGEVCPGCGHRRAKIARKLAVKNGLLRELKREKRAMATTPEAYTQCWWRAIYIARARRLPFTVAATIFKNATGKWPEQCGVELPYCPKTWPERKRLVSEVVPQKGSRNEGSRSNKVVGAGGRVG